MATPARGSDDGTADRAGNATPNQSRLRISKKTIDNAKATAQAAIDGLSFAAEMTEAVPYLGAVSKALTTFKEVLDEVDEYKDDCRLAKRDAEEIHSIVEQSKANWVQLDTDKKESLREALTKLGVVILECLEALEAVNVDSRRKRDRIRHFFKRDELKQSVKTCREKMKYAKDQLSLSVAFDTNHLVRQIHQHLQPPNTVLVTMSAARPAWRLRAANSIFHGRDSEVEAAADLIVGQAPARVAILGPGGIGKTSIALAVLHDPKVKGRYGDRRCFMSCEATTTADAVVRALATALRVVLEENCSAESARERVFLYLEAASGIICVDNLEIALDADKRAVEQLLNDIAALPSIALLITSRDTSIPTLKWTSPRLEHIQPFSQEAALATWDDICDVHDDYTEKLIEAVDCVPLAVTLLARLASIEKSTKLVWDRWEAEHTDMISDADRDDRLYSVSASIELSLRGRGEAAGLLGIMSIFHDAFLGDDFISSLGECLKDRRESVATSLSLLKRLSLIYTETTPRSYIIHILSPIRHHMQQHHVSDELFLQLTNIELSFPGWNFYFDVILRFGWNRPACRERCFQMLISNAELTDDADILSQAAETARELELQIEPRANLQFWLSDALVHAKKYEDARTSYCKFAELNEQLGDRFSLFHAWKEWVATFAYEFDGREDECQHLDEAQDTIQKTWELGRDESGGWNHDFDGYSELARSQHFVNEGLRKRHLPVVHRSGIYSGNESTVSLPEEECYDAYQQLLSTSSPPWDLSLILGTIETSHSASEESTSSEGSSVSFEGSINSES